MNLYIIRHGIAEELTPTVGYNDSQRALTETGRKKMHKIALGLISLEVKLDLIISSPYRRANETAAILADEFKINEKLVFSEHLLPAGDSGRLIAEINQQYRVENLALIGHEPSLSELISRLLTGETHLSVTLKKGGVCSLTLGELRPERCARLEWFLTPAQLIRLGS